MSTAPRRASRVRASSSARAPSSPRYPAALVDAPVFRSSPCRGKEPRLAVLFAELLHVAASFTERHLRRARRLRCGRARCPRRRRPRCALRQFEVDMVPPPHTHATLVTQGSLEHDEHALPSWAFLAPAPSRAAAHLVIIRCHPKKVVGTRETTKLCFHAFQVPLQHRSVRL